MKTWAIACFTLRETIRTKTMITGMVISLIYLAIVPMLSNPGSGNAFVGTMDKAASARDFLGFALNGLNFIGMFMAIFTTLGAIYSEIEKGTILSVVTKPLHRWQVIAGKWLGHVLLMSGYVLIMGLALWVSVALGAGAIIWRFFPAVGLVCLNVITMVSLTLAFSTFLPIVANAIFVFLMMVFTSNLRIINAISQTSDSIFMTIAAEGLRMLLPVSEVSDLAGLVLMGRTSASEAAALAPRGWVFLYAVAYAAVMVVAASWIFRKKDLR